MPEIEAFVLADIKSFVPWPGFGPFESYEAEHTLEGGEQLELAGFEIDVLFTPGHSPGHVTFSIPDEHRDLLRRRALPAVDRPHRPARRRPRDAARVDPRLVDTLPAETAVYPGPHGHHDPGRRAGHQPVPGRAGEVRSSRPRAAPSDVPPDARRRLRLVRDHREVLGRAGYEPFETPVFEDTELFARGVGESTDIVQKEMFTFEDKAGRSLTLRPEATAAICRAYVEHGMHKLPQPVKLWTWGPFFRHEAPQAGRFRQFTQIDAEALGSDDPTLDAELILLLAEIFERAGAGPSRLRLSSLGTPRTRADYLDELRGYLRAREAELSEEVRERLDQNPLRAFDADHAGTQAVMAEAPRLIDRLDPDDAEHFAEVRALLDAAGHRVRDRPTLVRGLDYYTRTVFEFESERLGAQAALGGGGRYDGLIEELGGPPTPGVGLGRGRRADPARGRRGRRRRRRRRRSSPSPTRRARRSCSRSGCASEGIRVEMEQAGRSMKGQLKQADRIGARATVILGDAIEVKDMDSGEQREAPTPTRPSRWSRRSSREGPRAPTATAPTGRASCAPTTSASRCAWPAGCTAGATTAG